MAQCSGCGKGIPFLSELIVLRSSPKGCPPAGLASDKRLWQLSACGWILVTPIVCTQPSEQDLTTGYINACFTWQFLQQRFLLASVIVFAWTEGMDVAVKCACPCALICSLQKSFSTWNTWATGKGLLPSFSAMRAQVSYPKGSSRDISVSL